MTCKNFNFGIIEYYFEEQSGMFATEQTHGKNFYLEIREGKPSKQLGRYVASLDSRNHRCGDYGIFDDRRYDTTIASGESKLTLRTDAIWEVISKAKKQGINYNPLVDTITYGDLGLKKEDFERGSYYSWSINLPTNSLAEIIKKEIQVLIKKDGLDYQI
jgi:hypothetical protein